MQINFNLRILITCLYKDTWFDFLYKFFDYFPVQKIVPLTSASARSRSNLGKASLCGSHPFCNIFIIKHQKSEKKGLSCSLALNGVTHFAFAKRFSLRSFALELGQSFALRFSSLLQHFITNLKKRRRRDSNPWWSFPHNDFRGRHLKPLGHFSIILILHLLFLYVCCVFLLQV